MNTDEHGFNLTRMIIYLTQTTAMGASTSKACAKIRENPCPSVGNIKTRCKKHSKQENMSKEFNLGKLLKIIIAVLTALAGSLGIVSCAA